MLPEGLRSGYARFQSQRFARDCQKYRALATHGNHPGTLVISCCDSRATPEVIFDTDPGEMLVMRNIANIVPPFELGGQYHEQAPSSILPSDGWKSDTSWCSAIAIAVACVSER